MFLLLLLIFGTTVGYDIKCPAQSEWRLTANISCFSEDKYVCLFNLLEDKNDANSSGPDLSRIGSKLVFQPLFNLAECNAGRYQPIVFTTHGNSECLFLKSKCDEEGQVVYRNSSSRSDTICRCDYTQGYAFVSTPNNSCFCVPSVEDCSCFKVQCKKLSPDYRCIIGEEIITNTKCQEIHSQISYVESKRMVPFVESKLKGYIHSYQVGYFIIVSLVLFVILNMLKVLKNHISDADKIKDGICQDEPVLNTSQDEPVLNTSQDEPVLNTSQDEPVLNTSQDEPVLNTNKIIDNMDIKGSNVLMEAISFGEEVRRFVRIHVIGKEGVGKSCLVRRLLGQKTDDVKSTDGIDILRKCQIRTVDGKWIIGKVETDKKKMIRRLQQAVDTKRKQTTTDMSNEHLDKTKTTKTNRQTPIISNKRLEEAKFTTENPILFQTQKIEEVPVDISKPICTRNSCNSSLNGEQKMYIEDNVHIGDEKAHMKKDEQEIKQIEKSSHSPNHPLVRPVIDYDITEKISQEMEAIFSEVEKEKDKRDSEGLVECGIWDFAGQKDYYVTHQTFLTPHAIYLLVVNLKEDIHDIKARTNDENFDSIGEYIDFWFDSIHSFCKDSSAGKLNPPVILVVTHTDEYEEVEERKRIYLAQFQRIIGNQKKSNHKRSVIFLSNTKSCEGDIDKLREKISEIAEEMAYFEEKLPTGWIQLENALAVYKDLKKANILPWSTIEELARKTSITDKEDLVAFLTYQHTIGNIIFFNDIRDFIILDPNWLIKCFRCLVCDDDDNKRNADLLLTTDWHNLTDTGELSEQIINQLFRKEPELKFEKYQSHLLNVMVKFDIIIKPHVVVSQENDLPSSYFMPCMIRKEPTSLDEILKSFVGGKEQPDFSISPWLTLEFEFLSLANFNHILCDYIREYTVCIDETGRKAIYHEKAVFFLDKTKFDKLIICFSKNAISLQIWRWGNIVDTTYRRVLKESYYKIKKIDQRLNQNLFFSIKAKCSTGDCSNKQGRISNEDRTEACKGGQYFCEEHRKLHRADDIEKIWLHHVDSVVKEFRDEHHENAPSVKTLKKFIDENHRQKNKRNPISMSAVYDISFTSGLDGLFLYKQIPKSMNYEIGLFANNTESSMSVFEHVLNRNNLESRFISTCGDRNVLKQNLDKGTIVKINTSLIKPYNIIDLRQQHQRNMHIPDSADNISRNMFNNQAETFQYVLLLGPIPGYCIQAAS